MEITITIKLDKNELKSLTVEQKETVGEIKKTVSQYARLFDETCKTYDRKPMWNYMFLKQVQAWANDALRVRGYIFLNEVYEALGMSKTKVGQIVGWIYNEKNPNGDNFVDFGLECKDFDQFIRDYPNSILLDFNVDGVILDKI